MAAGWHQCVPVARAFVREAKPHIHRIIAEIDREHLFLYLDDVGFMEMGVKRFNEFSLVIRGLLHVFDAFGKRILALDGEADMVMGHEEVVPWASAPQSLAALASACEEVQCHSNRLRFNRILLLNLQTFVGYISLRHTKIETVGYIFYLAHISFHKTRI